MGRHEDGNTWLNNFPTRGRTNYPCYYSIAKASRRPPFSVVQVGKSASRTQVQRPILKPESPAKQQAVDLDLPVAEEEKCPELLGETALTEKVENAACITVCFALSWRSRFLQVMILTFSL